MDIAVRQQQQLSSPPAGEPATRLLDRLTHAVIAKQTGGVSPTVILLATLDWAVHLGVSPGKQTDLLRRAIADQLALQHHLFCLLVNAKHAEMPCVSPLPDDRRFSHPLWQRWPYNFLSQGFLLWERLWIEATTDVRGMDSHNEKVVNFSARQILDMWSPSNFLITNPEVLAQTVQEGGMNLVRGLGNAFEDFVRYQTGQKPVGTEGYVVGKSIAITPGKVIYRNKLIELIQYSPTTAAVHPEPVLIVPAWIMKYYILDLSPHNSLIRYLVNKGFTVFAVSWKNPDASYRDVGMEDYRKLGIMAALEAIATIVPEQKVHAVGYCLGGTLLAIAAAAMERAAKGDGRLKTMTLFAAQTDFSEPGELELFVSENQLDFLEDVMQEQGYLEGSQMAATFNLLRSRDLIWSRMTHNYLLGRRRPLNDLMAWNADATHMPARMHAEYLRYIFFENQLAEGRYPVDGKPVALRDIRVPIFAVGAERDHVSPWRSVFQINVLTDTDVTFLLTSGGHNVGVVSEPGPPRGRYYRVSTFKEDAPFSDPDTWLRQTRPQAGSWWPAWVAWLEGHSSAPKVPPPPMGAKAQGLPPLADAPGTYVFE